MKNRTILFGYTYENGVISFHPTEQPIFLRMTDMYLQGMSLSSIADTLNREQIEYSPGVTGWNKSRIMRLLLDERYTGKSDYPAIISPETRELLMSRKKGNSCLSDTDFTKDIYRLKVPFVCMECGSRLRMKTSESKRSKRRLCCSGCGAMIYIPDEDILRNINHHMMRFIENPDLIGTDSVSVLIEDAETVRLEREIEHDLERPDIGFDSTMEKIRTLAAMRYGCIDDRYYTDQRLKAIFRREAAHQMRVKGISGHSMVDLVNKTVKEIQVDVTGNIVIVLINGNISPEGA